MELITAQDPEARSADPVAENIAKLRALFPELITEGPHGASVDVDVLRQLVGEQRVTDADEKYGLTWHGKRRARRLALTPSTRTLRPAQEESVAWETTQNVVIEGDNLEVLKLLQKSYAGKVSLIYIDPPYNTGNDFVYEDDYEESARQHEERVGLRKDGVAVSSRVQAGRRKETRPVNSPSSGRFHTNWLNMMYPRLKLARNLLARDGVLVVSIDDNEVDNLRKCCTELFGEENFVSTVIWQKKYAPANDATWLSDTHDYLVVVAFDKDVWRPNLLPRTAEANARYANPDGDPRGDWKPSGLDVKTYSEANDYEITTPSGRTVRPPAGACWRVSRKRFDELVADNRIWFGKDGSNVPAIKRFLSEVKQGITPMTIWPYDEVGHSQEATQEVRALGVTGFDSPKPVRLLRRVIEIMGAKDGIVLDFFAGSGTTAHAVMKQNAEDGGTRRYILVQLDEPIEPTNQRQKIAAAFCDEIGKPRNVAELMKERLRRAAQKVREEHPGYHGDLGFRVYRLDDSNIRAWAPSADDLEATLFAHVHTVREGRTEADVLTELLLKLGLDLCVPIEAREVAGKTVYAVGAGALFVSLPASIARDEVEPLALGIIEWREELDPAQETTVVLRDGAFADDVAKANLAAILNQHGIDTVRSL